MNTTVINVGFLWVLFVLKPPQKYHLTQILQAAYTQLG